MNYVRPDSQESIAPFYEIRPGTRFFELISIFEYRSSMGLYMDQNRNKLEKAYSRSNFIKRCNRFLRVWKMLIQVVT